MSDTNYLNETNPEILRAIPRPGGLAKLLKDGPPKPTYPPPQTPDSSSGRKSKSKGKKRGAGVKITDHSTTSLTGMHGGLAKLFGNAVRLSTTVIEKTDPVMDHMTKEYRIYRGMETTPWVQEMDEILDDSLRAEMPNPLQDSIDLLSISISTVMLLAIGYADVPREHLSWTLQYLQLVRNDFDETPPNIQGIINHIEKSHASLSSLTDQDGIHAATGDLGGPSAPPEEPTIEEATTEEEPMTDAEGDEN